MNNKAQFGLMIISFAIIVIGLFFLAPILLKVFNSTLEPFSAGVGNVTEQAGTEVTTIKTTFTTFWDWVIIIVMLINIILLFISAFFIDTHPFFLLMFVVVCFLAIIFIPEFMSSVDTIYTSSEFSGEVALLPFLDFVRNYFGVIFVVIMVLVGVIMYAKIRLT